ncbi:unnamed protein product [Gongylonema pulchrum]|uniref:DIX domain-containing protein n=1 Tax=Gongylonema pulchrum TaxID=637853 RepID=A0A183EU74_9BILA|nr:unnamed protein product [Gongylonema pulchrum]
MDTLKISPEIKDSSGTDGQLTPKPPPPPATPKDAAPSDYATTSVPTSTKIYYHIDDETVPYCTDVMVPPDKITLGDFKRVLTRSNFKYYCKAPAPDSGVFPEVKVEIRDDNERLHRSTNGQFELFLLTSEGSSHSDGSSGLPLKSARMMVPGPAPAVYPIGSMAYRQAVQQFDHSSKLFNFHSFISQSKLFRVGAVTVANSPFSMLNLKCRRDSCMH